MCTLWGLTSILWNSYNILTLIFTTMMNHFYGRVWYLPTGNSLKRGSYHATWLCYVAIVSTIFWQLLLTVPLCLPMTGDSVWNVFYFHYESNSFLSWILIKMPLLYWCGDFDFYINGPNWTYLPVYNTVTSIWGVGNIIPQWLIVFSRDYFYPSVLAFYGRKPLGPGGGGVSHLQRALSHFGNIVPTSKPFVSWPWFPQSFNCLYMYSLFTCSAGQKKCNFNSWIVYKWPSRWSRAKTGLTRIEMHGSCDYCRTLLQILVII